MHSNNTRDNSNNNNNNNDTRRYKKVKTMLTLRNSQNKSSLNNDDNGNRVDCNKNNNNKSSAFILGDDISKCLFGLLTMKEIDHKYSVKVRLYSLSKVQCLHNHLEPTIRVVNLEDIIFHVGKNDLNSEKISNQIVI